MSPEDVLLSLVRSGELEIDDLGRIWRVKVRGGNPQRNYAVRPCQRRRAEYPTRDGYLLLRVMIDGKKTTALAHRVVWTHFNGPIAAGLTINHKNGHKSDNRPLNLETATQSEQRRHAVETLNVKRNRPKGERNPKAQLTAEQVTEIRRLRTCGVMVIEIAAKFGMKPRAISAICHRRTWKHV
ncbi:MAG: HNH endonuclease signature motif containing protein [Vicinamibacterales bacterium]